MADDGGDGHDAVRLHLADISHFNDVRTDAELLDEAARHALRPDTAPTALFDDLDRVSCHDRDRATVGADAATGVGVVCGEKASLHGSSTMWVEWPASSRRYVAS